MLDILTLALTHGLIALAVLNLLSRDELDSEEPKPAPKWAQRGAQPAENPQDEG